MADDNDELLYVDGKTFDTDDLTYDERRAIRRIIRNELWDESQDGPFDWDEVIADDIMAVTILVMMRRDNPQFTLKEALACKPARVLAPPTPPKQSSSREKASAASGSRS